MTERRFCERYSWADDALRQALDDAMSTGGGVLVVLDTKDVRNEPMPHSPSRISFELSDEVPPGEVFYRLNSKTLRTVDEVWLEDLTPFSSDYFHHVVRCSQGHKP